jgi:signal recognition particle GTPase
VVLILACLLAGGTRCHGFSFGGVSRTTFRSSFTGASQNFGVCSSRSKSTNQLNMMFDQLAKAISSVVQELGPRQRITEEGIKPALRSVRRALLDADVNIDVADALIDGVRRRSLGEEVIKGITADQQFIKAMYDELVDMMGGDAESQPTSVDIIGMKSSAPASTLAVGSPGNPAVVLLAGLQGAGKTTRNRQEGESVMKSPTRFLTQCCHSSDETQEKQQQQEN